METISRNIQLLIGILLLLASATAFAQDAAVVADAAVDKSEINIGDKIRYTITVDYAPDINIVFPDFGSHLAGFTIKDFGTGEPEKMRNKRIIQEQWYVLDTFKIGPHTIPAATIKYSGPEGDVRELKTPEISIEVKSTIKEGEEPSDIIDIKPPLDPPVSYRKLYLWGGTALCVLACGGIAAWSLLRWKRRGVPPVQTMRTPEEIAYDALDALSRSDLITGGRVKEYYFTLSDIVRHYIENRYQLMAPEQTTEEFLVEMSNADQLIGTHKQLIRTFLRHSDLVKFARYNPETQEIKDTFSAAVRLIDETKETITKPEQTKEQPLVATK